MTNNTCAYEYTHRNRTVKTVKHLDTVVAEFAYDVLTWRIEKKDLIDSNNTRRYYYNDSWQVTCEYNGSGTLKMWYTYGNYIDEALSLCGAGGLDTHSSVSRPSRRSRDCGPLVAHRVGLHRKTHQANPGTGTSVAGRDASL
jgi:hypothetical protein